ncbi:arrestin domain-containing protein [Aphelenchoides avenae]|nr:arrestin domain-containing protein [Aphelenchus avenae]
MSGLAPEEVFEKFEIVFDAGPDPIFHGGELITGSLRVQLKQQITIRAIRLQFKGRACWVGDSHKGAEVEKVYFDKDFILLERPPGHPEPGHFPWNASFPYSLPFECPLPKGCPTSYEGPQAFIRYFARVTLQTDEVESTQYMTKKGFTVVAPPELRHLLPPKTEGVHVGDTFAFGGCCCRGKVTAHINLPKSAYAPGENIIGTVTVDNRHPRHIIDHIEVRLVDRVTRASTPTQDADDKKHTKPTVNHRVLLHRKLDRNDVIKSKSAVQVDDVLFLTVPPVVPTTQGDAEKDTPQTPELIQNLGPDAQLARLLESPSTATLKFRKQPFVRIEYAIQVSLGPHVLIEAPIQIHPIPIYANGISFKPFVLGAQHFTESDEADKKKYNEPFSFTPYYPTYEVSPKPVAVEPLTTTETVHETNAVPNGHAEVTKTVEVTELPDGTSIVRKTEERVEIREYTTTGESHTQPHPVPVAAAAAGPESHAVLERKQEIVEVPLQKTESVPAPEPVLEAEPQPVEAEPQQAEHEPEGEQPEAQAEAVAPPADVVANPHIVEHKEGDVELRNGHGHIVTEVIEDGPAHTERKVETYEYTDEDGVQVQVQKTTEHTQISTTTTTVQNGA